MKCLRIIDQCHFYYFNQIFFGIGPRSGMTNTYPILAFATDIIVIKVLELNVWFTSDFGDNTPSIFSIHSWFVAMAWKVI